LTHTTRGIVLMLASVTERTREIGRHKVEFGSDAEVVGKFEKLALRVLPKAQVEELCDTVLNLEKIDDAGKLAHLLAGR